MTIAQIKTLINALLINNPSGDIEADELNDLLGSLAEFTEFVRTASSDEIDSKIASLVNTSPQALDTLNELADALGNDPDFATTITNLISQKLSLSGGDLSGSLSVTGQLNNVLPPTLSPTGLLQDIDFDSGNYQILDLTDATGNVTLTFTNAVVGANYKLKIVQSPTAIQLVYPEAMTWKDGVAPSLTTDSGSHDFLYLFWDGAEYSAHLDKNYFKPAVFVPPAFSLNPTARLKLIDLRLSDPVSDLELTGNSVTKWINKGVNGVNAIPDSVGNEPDYNSGTGSIDFSLSETEFLKLEAPVLLDGDIGWTMFIAFDPSSVNKYLLGSSSSGAFTIFIRPANIIMSWGSHNSADIAYSGWDVRKSGSQILEVTHLGHTATGDYLRLRLNNGVASTGGTLSFLADRTFLDIIGSNNPSSSQKYDGSIGALVVYNAPIITQADRDAAYNEILTSYPVTGS